MAPPEPARRTRSGPRPLILAIGIGFAISFAGFIYIVAVAGYFEEDWGWMVVFWGAVFWFADFMLVRYLVSGGLQSRLPNKDE